MFEPYQKSTGTQYTTTSALLIVALIFNPALLVASRLSGYVAVSIAVVCSAFCAAMAWFNSNEQWGEAIPSLLAQRNPVPSRTS